MPMANHQIRLSKLWVQVGNISADLSHNIFKKSEINKIILNMDVSPRPGLVLQTP